MNRPSTLDVARYCGLAPKLSAQYGTGRAAVMSTAFHAKCSGAADTAEKMMALTDDEREEIAEWKAPTPCTVLDIPLRYEQADKEMLVGLNHDLSAATDVLHGSHQLTFGTLDMAWYGPLIDGKRCAFVADIKKSRYTVDGPQTLQNTAYAFAYASLLGCTHFIRGLWIADEGEWIWEREPVEIDSVRGMQLGSEVLFAARNDGEATTGSHCMKCYGRLHCPEWLLAADDSKACADPANMSESEALAELLRAQAMEAKAAGMLANLKAYALVNKGIRDGKGKVFLPVRSSGRKSLNKEAVATALGSKDLSAFEENGKPYDTYRWVKER